MLKRLYILLFLLPLYASSQEDSLFEHEIELEGEYFFNSDAITNEFLWAFYNGSFIEQDLKDDVADRLRYINRFGADINAGINYTWMPDSLFGTTGYGINFGIKDRMHSDGIFSEDFYRVVMYGNKSFAGRNADLGNFKFHFLRYQQLSAGITFTGDSLKKGWGVSLSILKGERDLLIDTKRAGLFTSEDGRYIDFDLGMTAHRSDTAHSGPAAFNGWGASTDLFFEIPYLTWYHDGVLSVELYDLGFIQWNKKAMSFNVDSLYHFEGVVIADLFDLQEATFPSANPDSLLNTQASWTTGGYTTWLPAILSIHATTYYGKKFIVEKGINYRFFSNARPYYFAGAGWYITPRLETGINISYGGYGKFNMGLELEWKFLKRFKLSLNSYYLNGFLIPEKTGGQGISIAFSGRF